MQEVEDDKAGKRKLWLIVFSASLVILATFWAVDRSIAYLLSGFSAFSFFMVLRNLKFRQTEKPFENPNRHSYTNTGKRSVWDELKTLFGKPPGASSQQQSTRIVKIVLIVFVGLIFLSILVPIMLSDGSPEASPEKLQKARDFYNAGVYDSAAYFYRFAIDADPENADLYLERGNAFLNSNQYDSARLDYNQALKFNPAFKEAFYNKGLIHYNRKQYRDGINEVKKAMAVDPEYSEGMLLIGDCFYNSSLQDSAMIWYENAYSRGYRSAGLSHTMAYIYDTKGDTQRAIPLYKEALSYDTTRTEIYSRLGELVSGEEGNAYRQKAAQYSR